MRRYIDYINHGALKYIEMNKWIGPTAKHVGMKLCHPCAAYIWGRVIIKRPKINEKEAGVGPFFKKASFRVLNF